MTQPGTDPSTHPTAAPTTEPQLSLRIAMGQMLVIPGDLEGNLARAAEMIARAATMGARLIVLPECLDLGWTYPQAPALAAPIPGPVTDALCSAAARAGIAVAAGVTERAGHALYNAAVLIERDGRILATHRKVNELPFARELYTVGTSLTVTHTDMGAIGLDICADNSATSVGLGMGLADLGAQIIVSPSAWAVPPGHDNAATPYGQDWLVPYRAIAAHGQLAIVGVSNVGPVVGGQWDGWRCIGCSLAIGPDGQVLAQGPYGADATDLTVISVPLRDPQHGARKHGAA